jgi:hypothetical protein
MLDSGCGMPMFQDPTLAAPRGGAGALAPRGGAGAHGTGRVGRGGIIMVCSDTIGNGGGSRGFDRKWLRKSMHVNLSLFGTKNEQKRNLFMNKDFLAFRKYHYKNKALLQSLCLLQEY